MPDCRQRLLSSLGGKTTRPQAHRSLHPALGFGIFAHRLGPNVRASTCSLPFPRGHWRDWATRAALFAFRSTRLLGTRVVRGTWNLGVQHMCGTQSFAGPSKRQKPTSSASALLFSRPCLRRTHTYIVSCLSDVANSPGPREALNLFDQGIQCTA